MDNLLKDALNQVLNQYDEYIKEYNSFAEKLDELGAGDEIFSNLAGLCNSAIKIDLDLVCIALAKSLAI